MGRAHEVRAKKIAQTNAAKSALYNRASKEIYLAAKSGVPDPNDNLALRSAIEKWKAQHVTRDVIDRAIQKAKSKDAADFIAGRYEGFGPGGVAVVVDTLSDNEKSFLCR
jgi:transcriptional/translational regulatory protein YebC/TACO1